MNASVCSPSANFPGYSTPNKAPTSLPLAYNVTHSPRGASEAEKKLEALTQQLEAEMEKNALSEYYGMFKDHLSIIIPVVLKFISAFMYYSQLSSNNDSLHQLAFKSGVRSAVITNKHGTKSTVLLKISKRISLK